MTSKSSFTFHHRAYHFDEQYNPLVTVFICELGSSLRIVNRLSAADHRNEIWFSARVDSVLFNTVSRRTLRPTQPPVWEYRRPFSGIKWSGHASANIQYQTSIKIATITTLHYTSPWTKYLIKHKQPLLLLCIGKSYKLELVLLTLRHETYTKGL